MSPNLLVYAESGLSTKTVETTNTEGMDVLLVMVNLARIRTQIMLTEKSLLEGDNNMAFAHAYIPHSVIFPSIKDILEKVVNNSNSINRLESGLADMAFMVKSEVSIDKIKQKTKDFNTILDNFKMQVINPVSQTNKSLIAQTTILLLKDADKSYQLANAATLNNSADQKIENVQGFSKVDYQNALGLVNMSKSNYDKLASSVSKNRNSEINLSFAQLQDFMTKKLDKVEISRIISSIEKTLEDSVSNAVATSNISIQTAKTNETKGKTFADIQELSRGFGIYTGERKGMGQTDESSKGVVRDNIDQIRLKLENVLQEYKEKKYDESLSASRSAYLDSYENIEVPLRPINPDFTLDMEIKFAQLRNLIQSKVPYESVQAKIIEIRQGLDESERLVTGTGIIAPTIAFSTSFTIIFREGLESALIIGAILTYLEASRNDRFKKHVYYGIAFAVAGTALTWFIAEYIIKISGVSRELIEAIAGISAVAVLFWVSFWVLNKVETKKWIEFVKAKVWHATTTGSVMVFIMLSFFTVYREGFETVLFYQAMLSFAKYMEWYVIAGLLCGLAVIVGIVFLIKRIGKKLPLRVLFGLTMGVGAYMSIAFIGNAVRSFQEVGYISTTHLIGIIPRLDINLAKMTGIHPTLETVIAQLILLCVYVVGSLYILVIQPRRKKAIETSRKSMADFGKKQ
jgi:high-affinity iron transporter